MIPALTSSYRDWGFVALGFSAAALIEIALALASHHPVALALLTHGAWGMAVGPLVVWSLLLRRTIPHRIVLVLGALALVMYVASAV
ncbi:MAG TPA: hypothetical protein VN677_15045 [Gemmatimonadaceae bacterium]|jgi:hypothetical protein|nr:hypothetical protein [Gemmatimonadaceae bacterium]